MGSVLLLSQILCLLFFHSHFQPSHSSSNFSSPVKLCPADQSLALLQFKASFSMMSSYPWRDQPKTVVWREGTDCCSWDGVTCNMKTGHVIGLALRCSMLHGTLHSNSTLFFLHHLQKLDLSHNNFNRSVISSSFGQLLHLTHLNLSSSNFAGQVPPEISHLFRLASLDLSDNSLMLEPISFSKLAQNLTQLRELNLDYVDMSLVAPSSFMNLSSSLTSLKLRRCGLQGELPGNVFRRSNLQSLDLGSNGELTGSFPPYNLSNALSYVDLSLTPISIHLEPDSISHLKYVEIMYLDGCNFAGSNLGLLGNLTQLRELGLAFNQLGGEFPFSLGKLKQLEYLDVGYNNFIGPMPDDFANHTRLAWLDLSHNSFQGHLPFSLGNLKQLSHLLLSGNNFTGQILNQFSNLTQLIQLHLSNNKFDGKILSSLENLEKLDVLDLHSNNFTGEISNSLFNLTQLTWLDLSHNRFDGQISSSLGSLEKLHFLDLSSNNFSGKIPNSLFNLTQLTSLDLSNNRLIGLPSQINRLSGLQELLLSDNHLIGPIPSQISRLLHLSQLDLSHNLLDGTIPSSLFSMPSLQFLSLHNNHLSGRISPFLSNSLQYIDFSHNKLYGQIPPSVFKLQYLTALMLSSNDKLTGNISSVICKLKFLGILDLSNNSFSGFIPQCLGNFSDNLSVLNLGVNNFQGNIPSVCSERNNLRYLNFNGNKLKGVIPPSVINCVNIEFLDLGNNMIDDTFPSFLEMLPNLEVIILRSNKLHGSLKGPTANDSFSKLKIFDLSNNSLSGPLPIGYFNNFKAMMSVDQEMDYMRARNFSAYFNYFAMPYVYSITMTLKGFEIEFPKIQTALTILDLSCNKFTGKIPESLGKLKSLIQLNLSHNSLNGYIQPSLGNLTNLESLDLSSNMLAGRIPQQLVDLTFLEVLNLSYNQLEGSIPQGKQFDTFEHGSYEGNLRLCGLPLKVKCNNGQQPPPSNFEKEDSMFEEGFGWKAVAMGYGCGFVFGVSMGYVVFRTRKPAWFVKMKGLEGRMLPEMVEDDTSYSRRCEKVYNGSCQEEGIIFQAGSLNLRSNGELTGSFPPYNLSDALSYVDLSRTRISIHLEPDSISHLKSVEMMFLDECNFAGSNLGLLGNLTQLRGLGLASIQLGGQIPFSLGKLKQLEYLYLGDNHFIGTMPDDFANYTRLAWLNLSYNSFQGHLPFSLGNLKQLSHLLLSSNNFTGQILNQFSNLTQLIELDLSDNKFDGQISSSLGSLEKLDVLKLSSNDFTGKIPNSLFNLTQLTWLDLSNNKFYGQISSSPGNLTQLTLLDLSHNRFDGQISSSLGSLEKLDSLELSFNNFSGKIPNSLLNLTQLYLLDLSNNRLIGLPSQINRLSGLKELLLSDNQLIGPIPSQISRLSQLNYLDLSYNLLNGNSILLVFYAFFGIPPSLFKLENLTALMLSSNDKLTGNISSHICKLKFLEILDLSNNSFSGFIPQCLGNFSDNLLVLNLGVNNFQGNIPSVCSEGNNLIYLDFNGNQLKGVIPPSVINCVNIEFLDLGNNMIDDTFPSFFEMLPNLKVIILRSNKLHGSLKGPSANDSFSKLKIFDLSNNSLSGPLPTEYFNNFKAMMSVDHDMDYMRTNNFSTYVYSVTMTWKGLEIEFTKIQIALTILDLSSNKFTGKIPESLGKLKSLIQLNLSHNSLIGYIQPSLGNLTNLESLDLSSNMLAGRIPQQLVDLTFLAVLNLSYNQLEGSIPQGKQFDTFEHDSYEGNLRLCGLPLKVKCNNGEGRQPPPSNSEKEDSIFEEGFGWKAVAIGYGCGFVFGVSMGYVVFRTRKPAWFVKMVERGGHLMCTYTQDNLG
uniref:Uncharacterized protein n=1 Tax=Salix viminalis TaxID=40686 RepID=A0A6N2KLT7_SALVM